MKKIILLFAILLATTAMQSQDYGFGIGPKTGLATATLTNTLKSTDDHYLGLTAGLQIDYRFNDKIAITVEGYHVKVGAENDVNDTYLYLSYINTPVLFRYFGKGGFNVFAGPEVGFLIDSEVNEMDAGEVFNSTNFAATGGVGYRFNGGIGIDLKYSAGLTDVSDLMESKTEIIALSLAYLF